MVKKRKDNDKKRALRPEEARKLLVDVITHNPSQAYNYKQLAAILGGGSQTKEFSQELLEELKAAKYVDEVEPGRFQLNPDAAEVVEGVLDMTSSGAAYVTVEGFEEDVMIEASNTNHALNGDRVSVAIIRRRSNGRAEGIVREVIERSTKNIVGRVDAGTSFAFVIADGRKCPYDIFIPMKDINGAQNGQKVIVRIVDFPANMKNPVGVVLEVLGDAGDNNTEMHAILAEYGLPYTFPEGIEEAAAKIESKIADSEYKRRRDFRDRITFTIDPADAKDFDDALSIREVNPNLWEVGVHIADVTHYVLPNDTVDTEAVERATSIYLVDRTIPMLPEVLSNQLCSLRPNEEKLCFSAVFEIDAAGEIHNEWFGRTIIESDRRFAYEDAQAVIETGEGDFKDEVLRLHTLAQTLRAERFRNGSIAFERDEAKFVLDEKGKPLSVYFKEQKESNQLIEEFMLLANRKVAEFIGKKKGRSERTFVYRVHDVPKADKFDAFSKFIVKFGYAIHATSNKSMAKELNKLLRKIMGTKEENLISTLAIRSMAKAVYSTDNIGHYGLAFDYYTHFTSPIRRYPDMMVHRLLAHYLAGGKSADKDFYQELCDHSSAMELRAAEAERASIKYKMVEFMVDKIGQEFDGYISGITEWGIYVELSDTKIEGMVSLRDLNDDYYVFDAESYSVAGRTKGRKFTLGDGVKIKILRADLQRKQLDFTMVAQYDFHTREVDNLPETLSSGDRRGGGQRRDDRKKDKSKHSKRR